MTIRPEKPEDIEAIEQIVLDAFKGHLFSHQTEHLILRELRKAGADLLAALVAEEKGEVVGQIAFSPVLIDGQDCGWTGMGPLAARVDRQRRGIGSALVRAGLDEMKRLGKRGCVLAGDPAYYVRFGFKQADGLRLEGVPPQYFLALAFDGGALPKGEVTFHKAFGIER